MLFPFFEQRKHKRFYIRIQFFKRELIRIYFCCYICFIHWFVFFYGLSSFSNIFLLFLVRSNVKCWIINVFRCYFEKNKNKNSNKREEKRRKIKKIKNNLIMLTLSNVILNVRRKNTRNRSQSNKRNTKLTAITKYKSRILKFNYLMQNVHTIDVIKLNEIQKIQKKEKKW